jgi:hypothetical protein
MFFFQDQISHGLRFISVCDLFTDSPSCLRQHTTFKFLLHIEDLISNVHFQFFQAITFCSLLLIVNGIDYERVLIAMINNSSYLMLTI